MALSRKPEPLLSSPHKTRSNGPPSDAQSSQIDGPQIQTNGIEVPTYTYDQLSSLQRCNLRERARNIRDQLGRSDPLPTHEDELVKFILEAQATLLGKTSEDFGSPAKGYSRCESSSPWTPSSSNFGTLDRSQLAQPDFSERKSLRCDVLGVEVPDVNSSRRSSMISSIAPEENLAKPFRAGIGRRKIDPGHHFDNQGIATGNPREDLGWVRGKRAIPTADHFDIMGSTSPDATGSHGHSSDDFFREDALPFGIGNGKRQFESPKHMESGSLSPLKGKGLESAKLTPDRW